jgi:hypothetical protein
MAHDVCLSDMAEPENPHPAFFHVLFITWAPEDNMISTVSEIKCRMRCRSIYTP